MADLNKNEKAFKYLKRGGKMSDHFKGVGQAENQIKAGIYFSVGLTATSLAVPIIEGVASGFNIRITLFDWLTVFLFGLSFFFIFIGVWFNTDTYVNMKDEVVNDKIMKKTSTRSYCTPLFKWNPLSRACFWISAIIGLAALVRTAIIIFR